jgi:hypothetical protein
MCAYRLLELRFRFNTERVKLSEGIDITMLAFVFLSESFHLALYPVSE